MNRSDEKIICGEVDTCSKFKDTGKTDDSSRCSLGLEEEKSIPISFRGKFRNAASDTAGGELVNCKDVVGQYRDSKPDKPLFPVKFTQAAVRNIKDYCDKNSACEKEVCQLECKRTLQQHNSNYGVGTELDESGTKFTESTGQCECKFTRVDNIMDDMCFMDNDKAKIILRSTYGFKVEGKGELIVVKKADDKKLAPRPAITSGAGPLTLTTYFVPDVYVSDQQQQTVKMFIQIDNDGSGTASISKIDPGKDERILGITNCLPQASKETPVFVGDEGTTVVCDARIVIGSVGVTGSYLTAPVIVDAEYTYSQKHSATLNVRKASIPEGVTNGSDEEKELNRQFRFLPYYCPTREVDDVKPLVIYSPDVSKELKQEYDVADAAKRAANATQSQPPTVPA